MSRYFAGIDGGQSGTAAVVGDERGRVLGRGSAGPADDVGEPAESTRMQDACADALREALRSAGLREDVRFEAVVAGISGYDGAAGGASPQFPATRSLLVHDAPVAHAGAFAGGPGVVVIAGTGSVVYARVGTRSVTLGGWGYLFGDEGSAFWLAREAIAQLMRADDDGDASSASPREGLLAFLSCPTLRDVQSRFAHGTIARDRIAACAPLVLSSERFAPLARRGAERLADLVARAMRELGLPAADVSFAGGLAGVETYRTHLIGALRSRAPGARPHAPKLDPAAGALLLAYRESGLEDLTIEDSR